MKIDPVSVFNDADLRRRSVEDVLRNVEDALERAADPLGTRRLGPEILRGKALRALEQIRRDLTDEWTRTEPLPSPDRENQRIARCDDHRRRLTKLADTLLPILRGTSSSQIPVELEPVLKRGLRNAQGAEETLETMVISTTFKQEYHIRRLPKEGGIWSLEVDEAPADPEHTYSYVFAAPWLDQESLILHSVMLGHELGHVRVWRHGTRAAFAENFEVPLAESSDRLDCMAYAQDWLDEIAADLFAVYAIGPAAILGLTEVVGSPSEAMIDYATHPAAHRRVRVMVDALTEDLAYNANSVEDDWLQDILARARADVQTRGTLSSQPGDQANGRVHAEGVGQFQPEEVWAVVEPLLVKLRAHCKAAVGEDVLHVWEWDKEVVPASEDLANGLPCGECQAEDGLRESRTRVILNAGWRTKLHMFGRFRQEFHPSVDKGTINRRLDELVLKSLEVAQVRQLLMHAPDNDS